jgi:hypothetical protein
VGSADVIPAQVPDGLEQIVEVYGDPKVHLVGRDYEVDGAWERRNMATLEHGFIPNARQAIYCHRMFAPLLGRLLDAWSARVRSGDPYRLVKLACFSPRLQRGAPPGSQLYSTHSWGIAIDANENTNRLVAPCPLGDPRRAVGPLNDLPEAWLDDARQLGLVCGADFKTRSDRMHIQACHGY